MSNVYYTPLTDKIPRRLTALAKQKQQQQQTFWLYDITHIVGLLFRFFGHEYKTMQVLS